VKKKVKKENKPPSQKVKPEEPKEKEDQFDFGGLPKRDLKKSLGC